MREYLVVVECRHTPAYSEICKENLLSCYIVFSLQREQGKVSPSVGCVPHSQQSTPTSTSKQKAVSVADYKALLISTADLFLSGFFSQASDDRVIMGGVSVLST